MNETPGPVLQAIKQIAQLIGDRITTNKSILDHHGHDESWHKSIPPDAVCFPHSIDDVSGIAAICYELEVPIIPYGTGTGMEGHVVAVSGGISIDMSQMNNILQLHQQIQEL